MSDGPYLILAAFWQDDDNTDAVAEAVSREKFPQPEGWPRGAVVAFRREVATGHRFLADLSRFDLADLDPHRPTRSEQSLEGAAVNGLTPVGQEAEHRDG